MQSSSGDGGPQASLPRLLSAASQTSNTGSLTNPAVRDLLQSLARVPAFQELAAKLTKAGRQSLFAFGLDDDCEGFVSGPAVGR